MTDSNEQFAAFADTLFNVFKEFEQKANDDNYSLDTQMMWAIAANLAVKIAATAQAVSIQHEGTKQ
jgi:hypothetical protein